jgi:hypothetical protein
MTPSGIEPATFRFVAQYLNHCATISGSPDRWGVRHCGGRGGTYRVLVGENTILEEKDIDERLIL